MVVLKLSGDMFDCDREVLYMSTYVPPPGSPFYGQAETQCHITEVDRYRSDLVDRFGDLYVICNGDFNAQMAKYRVNRTFSQSDGADNDRVESHINNESDVTRSRN